MSDKHIKQVYTQVAEGCGAPTRAMLSDVMQCVSMLDDRLAALERAVNLPETPDSSHDIDAIRRQARDEALEEAARVCERAASLSASGRDDHKRSEDVRRQCGDWVFAETQLARAIRALKSTKQ